MKPAIGTSPQVAIAIGKDVVNGFSAQAVLGGVGVEIRLWYLSGQVGEGKQ